jgi:hypothetical protein
MSKTLKEIDSSDLLYSSALSNRYRQHSCALTADRYLLPFHKDELVTLL